MRKVKPVYIISLAAVVVFVVFIKVTNPYREYSTREYWESATLASVYEIPQAALEPGNRNGGVLMWAAMATAQPEIIAALVDKGADINESDGIFKGTPLSGAAGFNANPAIIDELIRLGADVHQRVHNKEDALMVAARYNTHPGIIPQLVRHGADIKRTNAQGETALDLALKQKNTTAIADLHTVLQWQEGIPSSRTADDTDQVNATNGSDPVVGD